MQTVPSRLRVPAGMLAIVFALCAGLPAWADTPAAQDAPATDERFARRLLVGGLDRPWTRFEAAPALQRAAS